MLNIKYLYLTITAIFVLLVCVPQTFGQDRTKIIQVARIEISPKIDGLIEETCWKSVQPVSGFFQFDPINGAKASEETHVWAVYDQKYIYFAFLMVPAVVGDGVYVIAAVIHHPDIHARMGAAGNAEPHLQPGRGGNRVGRGLFLQREIHEVRLV